MRPVHFTIIAALGVATVAPAKTTIEHWSATSKTAMSITGDISLSPTRLVMAKKILPLAVAADVPDFGTSLNGAQPARILKVTTPADPKLLNGNTLCGVPVHWIAVYRTDNGNSLNMAVFSGLSRPKGEADKGLCGTFLYSR